MKCACISCIDHYNMRLEYILPYFEAKQCETLYITSDFNHANKSRWRASYPYRTIQIHVPKYKKNISIMRLLSYGVFSSKIRKVLESEKPDIIYCNIPPNSSAKAIIDYKRKHGGFVIFDIYDTWPESFPGSRLQNLFSLPFSLWKRMRDKSLIESDFVLTVSHELKDKIQGLREDLQVETWLPTILDTVIPDYQFNVNDYISLCYLGNINSITDIELAVELISAISSYKKVHVHIIGEGENLDAFNIQLKAAGAEVYCYGVMYDMTMKNSVFSKCNFGLNIPRQSIHASMSLKSVEYMRAGLPMINSGIGDNAEIVDRFNLGFNVNKTTVDDTAKRIAECTASELRQMHINSLAAYKELFQSQSIDTTLDSVLQNVILL